MHLQAGSGCLRFVKSTGANLCYQLAIEAFNLSPKRVLIFDFRRRKAKKSLNTLAFFLKNCHVAFKVAAKNRKRVSDHQRHIAFLARNFRQQIADKGLACCL